VLDQDIRRPAKAEKFLDEVELRTGMGSALPLRGTREGSLYRIPQQVPEVGPYVEIGTAEPE
jgi:hypothetical protein